MYVPAAFAAPDHDCLHRLMRDYSFAALVSVLDGRPFASHLPFILDIDRGPYGTLRAHMARANPHSQTLGSRLESLVVFQGPHAYVSPNWYRTHPSVPTWDYAVVHAYGIPSVLDDAALDRLLNQLVAEHEKEMKTPWSAATLPVDYRDKMRRAVVGFEIEIARLEGKFKLSQNRDAIDRRNVQAALEASEDALGRETAVLMRELAAPK